MKEDEKVSHLMKGVAEDIYQALLTRRNQRHSKFYQMVQLYRRYEAEESCHDVILGWDFLEASQAVIDCGQNELVLEGICRDPQRLTPGILTNRETSYPNYSGNFSGLFTKTDKSTAAKTNVKHRIFTGDHAPINQRAYRVSPTERRIIHEEVQKMLDEGIVQPSESPWSSPVVLKHKNGCSEQGGKGHCVSEIRNLVWLPKSFDRRTAMASHWENLRQKKVSYTRASGDGPRNFEPWSSDQEYLLTTTPHQREDVSAVYKFNVHRCPTRRVFSDTGLEPRDKASHDPIP
ncbi:transposon Ty3-I Gag-Pol polyprotein [Trichonephila clavipes]|uniref:Transposon Ty3-I Gag-Pol polyprotein n=1 Tax=Trichonephila clavipes TaxID=2585209 RepID=A0A8X6R4A0_TRICX|nr:transposon Ty3-I Gag-Pol polyprotein [Trichonephila clavipes]